MKSSNIIKTLLFCLLTVALGSVAFAEQVAVITHPNYKGSSISQSDLKNIFLGKKKTLPDGGKVTPIDQPEGSAARKEFYSKVLKKNPKKLKAYWAKKIFSGRGTPPKIIGDDSAVLDWVANHPGALGYVKKSAVGESKNIKVLKFK